VNFEQALSQYIGRRIEVFLANTFVQGILLSVSGGIISVNAVSSSYSSSSGPVDIVIASTEYVRVLVL